MGKAGEMPCPHQDQAWIKPIQHIGYAFDPYRPAMYSVKEKFTKC